MLDNWTQNRLGNFLKLKGGYAFKSGDFIEHGDVPVLRISNIKPNGTISLEDAVYVDKELAVQNDSFLLNPGNIVIAMSGATTGKTAVVKESDVPALINQRVGLFQIYNVNILNETYLKFVVQSEEFKNAVGISAIGGAQPNISGKQIEEIVCDIPPIEEQRKIAHILNSVDNAVSKTEAIIEQTEKVKKGLMQQLLTKGIGHTKFKHTEIGEIPEEWVVCEVQSFCNEIFLGLTSKVDYVEHEGIPLIRATDINKGVLSFKEAKLISSKQHEYLTRLRKAEKGDVLVSKSGNLGTIALVDTDQEFSIYESIICLKPIREKVNQHFLLWYLRSEKAQQRMLGEKVGSGVGHLNLKQFRTLIVAVPNLDEQERIAKLLNTIQGKIVTEEEKLKSLQDIKVGLMQVLLTGKVRVKVDDQEVVYN